MQLGAGLTASEAGDRFRKKSRRYPNSSLCDPSRANRSVFWIWLVVDQEQVGLDVALTITSPIATQGVVTVTRWQSGVRQQQLYRSRQQ
jgi:hypothetical protein